MQRKIAAFLLLAILFAFFSGTANAQTPTSSPNSKGMPGIVFVVVKDSSGSLIDHRTDDVSAALKELYSDLQMGDQVLTLLFDSEVFMGPIRSIAVEADKNRALDDFLSMQASRSKVPGEKRRTYLSAACDNGIYQADKILKESPEGSKAIVIVITDGGDQPPKSITDADRQAHWDNAKKTIAGNPNIVFYALGFADANPDQIVYTLGSGKAIKVAATKTNNRS